MNVRLHVYSYCSRLLALASKQTCSKSSAAVAATSIAWGNTDEEVRVRGNLKQRMQSDSSSA